MRQRSKFVRVYKWVHAVVISGAKSSFPRANDADALQNYIFQAHGNNIITIYHFCSLVKNQAYNQRVNHDIFCQTIIGFARTEGKEPFIATCQ